MVDYLNVLVDNYRYRSTIINTYLTYLISNMLDYN